MLTLQVKDTQLPTGACHSRECSDRPQHGVRSPTSTVTLGRDAVCSSLGWPLSVSGLGDASVGAATPPVPCSPSFISIQRLLVGAGPQRCGQCSLHERAGEEGCTGEAQRRQDLALAAHLLGVAAGLCQRVWRAVKRWATAHPGIKGVRKKQGGWEHSRASCQVLVGPSGAAWSPGRWGGLCSCAHTLMGQGRLESRLQPRRT